MGKLKDKEEILYFSVFHFLPLVVSLLILIFQFQFSITGMITFVCCLIALIVGYFVYGTFIERIFGIDAKRADSCLHTSGRRGLYPDAYLESLYDPVSEHRRIGTDLRRHYGGEVRNRLFPVDRAG